MNFFLLRHRATGKLMPQGRATWWDPSTDRSTTPRLFSRITDAKNAKRYWEAGALTYYAGRDRDPFFGDDEPGELRLSTDFGTDRKLDDLEIIPATLSF